MVLDGFSDCFADEEKRDVFFNKLRMRAKKVPIPSDTEVCKGVSPYAIVGAVPYPFCVNHRWEIGDVEAIDSPLSHKWDNWRVRARDELGSSDELFYGPERVEEFDTQFLARVCEKLKKVV